MIDNFAILVSCCTIVWVVYSARKRHLQERKGGDRR